MLSPKLSQFNDFPYTAEEQVKQAEILSSKLSIQGVQPKLSASLNIKGSVFQIVESGGCFILKPQIERLVGWLHEDVHPVLSSIPAYELAYDTICDALGFA